MRVKMGKEVTREINEGGDDDDDCDGDNDLKVVIENGWIVEE